MSGRGVGQILRNPEKTAARQDFKLFPSLGCGRAGLIGSTTSPRPVAPFMQTRRENGDFRAGAATILIREGLHGGAAFDDLRPEVKR